MTTESWTDPSAMWSYWRSSYTDVSSNVSDSEVDTLRLSGNQIYVGGQYFTSSKGILPFVSVGTIGGGGNITWTDPSSMWNIWRANYPDVSNNNGVVSILELSGNQIFTGGFYKSSLNGTLPFVSVGTIGGGGNITSWTDPSSMWNIWKTSYPDVTNNGGGVNTLELSGNQIFIGGDYKSTSRGILPFVSAGSIGGGGNITSWTDPSSMWNIWRASYPDVSSNDGEVKILELSGNQIFTGGDYKSSSKGMLPFVSAGIVGGGGNITSWTDPSSMWNIWKTSYPDVSSNDGTVLTLELSGNQIFTGGDYKSTSKGRLPFVSAGSVGGGGNITSWTDPSSMWNIWRASYPDVSSNDGEVHILELSGNQIYTGGSYQSSLNNDLPFVSVGIIEVGGNITSWTDPGAMWSNWNSSNPGVGGGVVFDLELSGNQTYTGGEYFQTPSNILPFVSVGTNNINIPTSNQLICFKKGTKILTPDGFMNIEQLNKDDLISTLKGNIKIKKMVHFFSKNKKTPLYCLPKNVLGLNKPINDLYMSGDHAFKSNGLWRHMKCSSKTKKIESEDKIEYYHIIIDDYFAHTINAEGVEVETCFKQKDDRTYMLWNCTDNCCIPLECHIASKKEIQINNLEKKNNNNLIPFQKVKHIDTLLYLTINNKYIPLICSETELPKK